jgi:hypothetical protein
VIVTLDRFAMPKHVLDELHEKIFQGMVRALEVSGSCTVEDGYAALDPDEFALVGESAGMRAVFRLKRELGLRRVDVARAGRPSRKQSYVGVWSR